MQLLRAVSMLSCTIMFLLTFIGSSKAESGELRQALKLFRVALECPLEPCDTHCGISTGYNKRTYDGDLDTLKITDNDIMVKGTETSTIVANYKDIDPAKVKQNGTHLALVCFGWEPKKEDKDDNEQTQNVGGQHACIEWNTPTGTGDEIQMTLINKSKINIDFCDKGAAENATVALKVILGHLITPSFDCSGKTSDIERAICADGTLAAKDRALQPLYDQLRHTLSGDSRHELNVAQISWLSVRDKCRNPGLKICLAHLYNRRIRELQSLANKQGN